MSKLKLKADARFGWLPIELLNSNKLSAKAKLLWAYMNSKPEGWDFSTHRMASEMQEGIKSIRNGINELIDAGYVVREKQPDGHVWYSMFEVPQCQKATEPKRLRAKTAPINKIDNKEINRNISNKDLIVPKGTIGENADGSYGKVEINGLFDSWESITGLPITSNKTKNRYACNNLINKYGVDGVEKLIRVVEKAQTDRYAPRVADFCDLQAKLNQLLLWAKNQVTNSQVISVEDF